MVNSREFNKIMAETHPEVWRQFQLFIKKERPREHEAYGVEVAEEREMVGPPPKKTKGEKAEETAESSEAEETMENAQEESVDILSSTASSSREHWIPLGTSLVSSKITLTTMACLVKLKRLEALLGTLTCFKRYLPWCSKLKRRTRGKRKMTKQTQ